MMDYLTDEEMDEIEIRFGAKHVEPKYKKGEREVYTIAILAVITAIMVGLR